MRLAFAAAAVTIVLGISLGSTSSATADEPSALAKAGEAMNPMNWSMPKWKKPQWNFLSKPEPPRITKKDENVFSTVSRKTASGWNKTKQALSPSNLFPASQTKSAPVDESPGFFSSMFPPKAEPKKISTPNDFLSLPRSLP